MSPREHERRPLTIPFITKPVTFAGLADAMRAWSHYWLELVELPIGMSADGYGLRTA